MSTIKVDSVKSSVAGVAPVIRDLNNVEVSQGCTAWINFNGAGVVAIRDSFNVSGLTDNGVGRYTVNFATPMANANYVAVGTGHAAGTFWLLSPNTHTRTLTSFHIDIIGSNLSATDASIMDVAIFGGK